MSSHGLMRALGMLPARAQTALACSTRLRRAFAGSRTRLAVTCLGAQRGEVVPPWMCGTRCCWRKMSDLLGWSVRRVERYSLVVLHVPNRFRFVDLFAGIGGFHHALGGLGGRCVMACELDPECRSVYRASFPKLPAKAMVENIRSLTRGDVEDERSALSTAAIARRVPDHDVLCGGFPCQPFSKSGAQQGVRDRTRGTLFFDILEILRAKHPRFVVLENVRNLCGPRHRDTWRTIIESLREVGYRVSSEPVVLSPHLIPPELGGAPQVRDRVFILGEYVGRGKQRGVVSPPLLTRRSFPDWNPDRWSIRDLLDPDVDTPYVGQYRVSDDERMWLDAWDSFVREIQAESLPGFPIWVSAFRARPKVRDDMPDWERAFLVKNSKFYVEQRAVIDRWLKRTWGSDGATVLDFPPSRQMFEWQARRRHPLRQGRTLRDLVIQMRPSGIRVRPPTYLPALVAINQTSIIGPDVAGLKDFRKLTPREAARLQGIPVGVFSAAGVPDRAAYKQLGNAVNVGVAALAARTLFQSARPDTVEDHPEVVGSLFSSLLTTS